MTNALTPEAIFVSKLQDMFVGGSDTTATSLEWAMTELMRKHAVCDKRNSEITSTGSFLIASRISGRC